LWKGDLDPNRTTKKDRLFSRLLYLGTKEPEKIETHKVCFQYEIPMNPFSLEKILLFHSKKPFGSSFKSGCFSWKIFFTPNPNVEIESYFSLDLDSIFIIGFDVRALLCLLFQAPVELVQFSCDDPGKKVMAILDKDWDHPPTFIPSPIFPNSLELGELFYYTCRNWQIFSDEFPGFLRIYETAFNTGSIQVPLVFLTLVTLIEGYVKNKLSPKRGLVRTGKKRLSFIPDRLFNKVIFPQVKACIDNVPRPCGLMKQKMKELRERLKNGLKFANDFTLAESLDYALNMLLTDGFPLNILPAQADLKKIKEYRNQYAHFSDVTRYRDNPDLLLTRKLKTMVEGIVYYELGLVPVYDPMMKTYRLYYKEKIPHIISRDLSLMKKAEQENHWVSISWQTEKVVELQKAINLHMSQDLIDLKAKAEKAIREENKKALDKLAEKKVDIGTIAKELGIEPFHMEEFLFALDCLKLSSEDERIDYFTKIRLDPFEISPWIRNEFIDKKDREQKEEKK
jgi:G:T-mismatch repair DNA endonuclease (very short patch repair protein)